MINLKRNFGIGTSSCGRARNTFVGHEKQTSRLKCSLIQPCLRAKQGFTISYIQNIRLFSENSNRRSDGKSGIDSDKIYENTTVIKRCIDHFNNTAAVHGNASVITFLVLRNGTWYTLAALYSQLLTVGKPYKS
jgi:hypothetical protein